MICNQQDDRWGSGIGVVKQNSALPGNLFDGGSRLEGIGLVLDLFKNSKAARYHLTV